MYTEQLKNLKFIFLPKRKIKVLIGGNSSLQSNHITFGVTTVSPKTKMDSHTHNKEEEIIYILSGYGYVEIDNKKENIKEGTVIKLPVGCLHCISNQSDEEMNFTFCFNPPVEIGSYDKK